MSVQATALDCCILSELHLGVSDQSWFALQIGVIRRGIKKYIDEVLKI